jgi:hypothetical protein
MNRIEVNLETGEQQVIELTTEEIAEIQSRPTTEPPTQPQWVQFGAALAGDPSVNTMVATAAAAAPVLHLMLGVGLGQAAQGDPKTFLTAWSAAQQAGLVSTELAAHVAELGSGYDLPAEFLININPDSN